KKWWFKKHGPNIELLDYTRDVFNSKVLKELNYQENERYGANTVIDWSKVNKKFKFYFNYQSNEQEVYALLIKSLLNNFKVVLFDINTSIVVRVKTNYFIENWCDFFAASNYLGFMVTSEPIEAVMEFTEEGYLYS